MRDNSRARETCGNVLHAGPPRCINAPNLGFVFFQAEDGIRDGRVTGVQTCALPILKRPPGGLRGTERTPVRLVPAALGAVAPRSEERRVGKECRSRWSPYH